MAYLNLHEKSSSFERKVCKHERNTVPCRPVTDMQMTANEPSSQHSFHRPEIRHTGLWLEKCHWCTMTYIWCNELHYLFTHSSSSLVFKRLKGSWISFCTKGFSELLRLTVSSQCLPVVITWWHLEYSTAVFICAGVWRLQQWFSLHRAIAVFSAMRLVHRGGKKSLYGEQSCVQSPTFKIRLLLKITGIKSSHLIEVVSSRDVLWSFLLWFDVRA